ncbi:MAG: hypothetical protein AAF639_28735 [Chloroflexota bacterium]
MAYSFIDLYRPMRFVLRIQSLNLIAITGLPLLLTPSPTLLSFGLYDGDALWALRLVGALCISIGVNFLTIATQPMMRSSSLTTVSITNGLLVMVLCTSYFQQEFANLQMWGKYLLIFIVFISLACTVVPLRYMGLWERFR